MYCNKMEVNVTNNNSEIVDFSDIIFLAVKPQDIHKVLEEIRGIISIDKIIVSIAAGVAFMTRLIRSSLLKLLGSKATF